MKGSIPLTVGSRAPGASLPNPQTALDQEDSHGLCHMGISRAAHHSRHSVQPRTPGFWGLAHPAPPWKRGCPCPPLPPTTPRMQSEWQRGPKCVFLGTRGFPQGGKMPGAGRGRRGLSPQNLALPLPAWSDLSGAHKQQNNPSEAHSPHGLPG